MIVVAHAPTNRQVKGTKWLVAAVKRLQDEGLAVELDIIERQPWKVCLERKAKADIYVDQLYLGYGNNALEAWAMGIPVVAGVGNSVPTNDQGAYAPFHGDETLDEMERRFGKLPFYHATEETIYDALKELVEDPKLRARYGKLGYDYVRKYHDYPVVVEQLKRLYGKAMGGAEEQAA